MLKIKIDFSSFFKKGTKKIKDDFLVCLINGYQGSGKTYFAIYNLEHNFKGKVVYTNIKSYKSKKHDVRYFSDISELYNNHDKNAIFVIDELSKRYTKNSPIDKAFYSWLQQSRKHNRYVYMITQEYLQVPNWLRGIATLSYTTRKLPLLPIYSTLLGYPILDTETCEWVIQEIGMIIYKRTKSISNKYDTFELINSL